MNIVESIARQALAHPRSPALVTGGREITYGALVAQVTAVAAHLRASGVQPGEVVGIVGGMGQATHIVVSLAVAWMGGVSASLTLSESSGGYDEAVKFVGVSTVVHNGGFKWPAGSTERLIDLRDVAPVPASQGLVAWAEVGPGDLWRISFSSGTTGKPKTLGCTHGEQLLRNYLAGSVYPCVAGQRLVVGLGVALSFSLHYWLRTLSFGGVVICVNPDPQGILEAAHRHDANVILTSSGTAIGMAQLVRTEDSPYVNPPESLQRLIIGGGFLSPQVCDLLRRHVCGRLALNFGSAEAGLIAVSDPQLQAADPQCTGRLLPWVEAQAVGEDGVPLPPGGAGALRLRSPTLAWGYYPAGTSPEDGGPPPFREGWFYSADFGRVTNDGRVYLRARTDVLNLGGVKMDAARIESAILQDAAVLDCVAVTAPAGPMGEPLLLAVVVAPQGVDVASLQQRCSEALGSTWVPWRVITVADLPRNAGGKVMRNEVLRRLRMVGEER